jgi:hypothetical protein
MRRHLIRAAAVASAAVLTAASAARVNAVPLVNQNFDAPPAPAYQYAYGYAGGGNPQTDRSNLTETSAAIGGVGLDGSNGLELFADFTGLTTVAPMPDYNYSGFGGGFGTFFYDFGTNTAQGLPSGNLADYTGSIDLMIAGSNAATAPTEIQVQLQLPDDFFGPDADTNFTPFAQINIPVSVGAQYDTFNFSLDQGTLVFDAGVPAAERNFAAHFRDIGLINFNFNVDAGAAFGNDEDNFLYVDNVTLGAVPEPGSAALLLGVLGMGLARRRRR